MQVIKKVIFVTTFFNAFHHWPDAPDEVAFLRNLHRHRFGVKVGVYVSSSNREVEFFILQNEVNKCLVVKGGLTTMLKNKPSMSCEMMAEFIGQWLAKQKYSLCFVEVDEDRENGARVMYQEI